MGFRWAPRELLVGRGDSGQKARAFSLEREQWVGGGASCRISGKKMSCPHGRVSPVPRDASPESPTFGPGWRPRLQANCPPAWERLGRQPCAWINCIISLGALLYI